MPSAEWILYETASGRQVVEREISKAGLSKTEASALQALTRRIATGEVLPSDVKYIKTYKLWEARLSADRRELRLLYAKRGSAELVCVGLEFLVKKSRRLRPDEFRTASKRLADWDAKKSVE